jgi:hypothetical protein
VGAATGFTLSPCLRAFLASPFVGASANAFAAAAASSAASGARAVLTLGRPPFSLSEAAAAAGRGAGAEGVHALLSERSLEGGRVERRYADGSRVLVFGNGTEKERRTDGTAIVRYSNGDVQRTLPSAPTALAPAAQSMASSFTLSPPLHDQPPQPQLVELYYFAASQTLQATFAAPPTGTAPASSAAPGAPGEAQGPVQVFGFGSGQVEAVLPDGSKEVLFADGEHARKGPPPGGVGAGAVGAQLQA